MARLQCIPSRGHPTTVVKNSSHVCKTHLLAETCVMVGGKGCITFSQGACQPEVHNDLITCVQKSVCWPERACWLVGKVCFTFSQGACQHEVQMTSSHACNKRLLAETCWELVGRVASHDPKEPFNMRFTKNSKRVCKAQRPISTS